LKNLIKLIWKIEEMRPKTQKSEETSGEGRGGPLAPLALLKGTFVLQWALRFVSSDHIAPFEGGPGTLLKINGIADPSHRRKMSGTLVSL